MMKIFLGFIAVLVFLMVGYLFYLGAFSRLVVTEGKSGPFTVVYESFTGDYAKTGPVFNRLYAALTKENINAQRGLGIYYDNPKEVVKDKRKSDCSVIIEPADLPKLAALKNKFNIKKIKKADVLMVEFPLKNSLSYFIGPAKGYPALTKALKAKNLEMGGQAMELYDMPAKKIYYILEVKTKPVVS